MREGPPQEEQAAADAPALETRVDQRLCYTLSFFARGELVGRAQLHFHDGRTADIVDLFVVPERRGRGLGRAILRHCLTVARTLGAQVVTAHTAPANRPAYRLFLSLGFGPCQEEHHLELDLDRI